MVHVQYIFTSKQTICFIDAPLSGIAYTFQIQSAIITKWRKRNLYISLKLN